MNVGLVFFILVFSCGALYLLFGFLNARQVEKRAAKELVNQRARNNYVEKALQLIISCNSYPPLALVFRNLQDDIIKYDIKVNSNFKGYFKNEERTI